MQYKLIYVATKETQLNELIGKNLNILQDNEHTYLLFENNKYVKVESKEIEKLTYGLVALKDSHSLFVLDLI